jgi:hypothetical protein
MGFGSFDPNAYRAFAASTSGKSTQQIYTSTKLDDYLNPKGVKIRESRDSDDHPKSTPLIVALDVTGSMGILADTIARKGLGVLFNDVIDHEPITDPQIMFMGIGDARCDQSPLQVSQFESDNRVVEQLTKLYLEHGGGGNAGESYDLSWYFAARHTEHDSHVKRGKRGYLFTVGDEPAPPGLTVDQIAEFIGDKIEVNLTAKELLNEAQRTYNVFHIVVEEGGGKSYPNTLGSWTDLLDERVIRLPDHTQLGETIVAALLMAEGADKQRVATKYGQLVGNAVGHLPRARQPRLLPA